MPSLSQHHSNNLVKLLLLGDSKAGKTSSLASLVGAGYKLFVLDFDNLLDVLAARILESYPDKLGNVEYRSMRDKLKGTDKGVVIDGSPVAWTNSLKMLNNWKYTDEETGEVIDYGKPAEWGSECILVVDSLSRWSDAAMDFHEVMNRNPDRRAIFYSAQKDVEAQIAGLTSPHFQTNVIVICHGVLQERPDGTKKLFPKGIGSALSPIIPTYFPNYLQLTRKGDKRTFKTSSNNMIDLATAKPVPDDLDASTGLAEFFAILRGAGAKSQVEQPAPKPKALTLRRA